ncbi:glycerol-3-phosphate dehydrogenase/oxidase [Dictyobacter formicarum]|uniref:Glycerol-3-phosphate dehydrogenase n=1 Tax=Dictyobacter formicarum TaxID=2778368 RepID=A0ABQ3VB19_9CHLR|nr:glycerol-3-phosphate dehydrogenase/oxidase [Dictyobacter formicarum]GHO83345.1 glycerol-3-phosphate dehydrogenase [Dictyobacter formicarum]
MQPLSSHERTDNLNELANNSFDILVIGGGVTGAGVALDAVSRGYSVALVEKADFASGTSSKSTKLVHGGIRYLPNFDFSLVHEALVERGLLLQNAPFLVDPVAFVLPIYEGDMHPVGMPFTTPKGIGLNRLLDAGLWMYDGLAGRRNISRHHHISRQEVLERAPTLVSEGLKEGFIYYDGQTNDARLTMAVLRTAVRSGALVANYAEVTGFEKSQDRITGAIVHDTIGDQQFTVRARHIVNATGVFSEEVESLAEETPEIQVEPSKGVHLVLSREMLQLGNDAIVLPETEDKRILFIVPWESRAIYGTTDTGTGDLNHPTASQEDIAYLLKYLNRYLTVHVTEDDIISTYAGYRPLVKPRQKNASTARLSRTHAVIESPSGLVTITGGKLTTYRRMAQDTLDLISRRDSVKPVHPTESLPLQGSAAWPLTQHELQKRGARLGLSSNIIRHLGHAYGSNTNAVFDLVEQDPSLGQQLISDLPYIKAEVIYACRYEMAMKPADILARRTSIVMEDRERGQGVVDEVTQLMAQELHWPSVEQQELMQIYRSNIQNQVLAEKR